MDAKYAEENIEAYNLTVATISRGRMLNQAVQDSTIKKTETQEYSVKISQDKVVLETPLPWWQQYSYWILGILVALITCAYVLRKRFSLGK